MKAVAGRVAERFKALVLKTSDGKPSVSSNLTSSAIYLVNTCFTLIYFYLPIIQPTNRQDAFANCPSLSIWND